MGRETDTKLSRQADRWERFRAIQTDRQKERQCSRKVSRHNFRQTEIQIDMETVACRWRDRQVSRYLDVLIVDSDVVQLKPDSFDLQLRCHSRGGAGHLGG